MAAAPAIAQTHSNETRAEANVASAATRSTYEDGAPADQGLALLQLWLLLTTSENWNSLARNEDHSVIVKADWMEGSVPESLKPLYSAESLQCLLDHLAVTRTKSKLENLHPTNWEILTHVRSMFQEVAKKGSLQGLAAPYDDGSNDCPPGEAGAVVVALRY